MNESADLAADPLVHPAHGEGLDVGRHEQVAASIARPARSAARRLGNWALLALWMAVIYIASDQPDLPHAPGPWLDFVIKKLLHAAGYAVLAGLWWRALAGAGLRRPHAWAFILTVAYAAADEWHQTFVPGRGGRPRDVAVDAAGALLALAWLRHRAGLTRRWQ